MYAQRVTVVAQQPDPRRPGRRSYMLHPASGGPPIAIDLPEASPDVWRFNDAARSGQIYRFHFALEMEP